MYEKNHHKIESIFTLLVFSAINGVEKNIEVFIFI